MERWGTRLIGHEEEWENGMDQAGWLQQFWWLDIQDPGVGRSGSPQASPAYLTVFSLCSHIPGISSSSYKEQVMLD